MTDHSKPKVNELSSGRASPKYSLAIWARQHRVSPELYEERRQTALRLAIEGINDGSIDSIDGISSPLSRKIQAHHGGKLFEMNRNWIETAQSWVCPCCRRNKFEIARVGSKGQILAKLVLHHDHMTDALEAAFHRVFVDSGSHKATNTGLALIERMAPAFSAYAPVLICEDCNNADAAAKKLISDIDGRIRFHSFSISQIYQFIVIGANSSHLVDEGKVFAAWALIRQAYFARMKLVHEVAKAAVLQDYWFEKYQSGIVPEPTLSNGYSNYNGLEFVSGEALFREMTSTAIKHVSNYSRWRTETQPARGKPPENFLAMIDSFPGSARMWGALPGDWRCPTCGRSKYETVSFSEGKISFHTHTPTRFSTAWNEIKHICAGCSNVVTAMKRELKGYGIDVEFAYDCISPESLRLLITARPHSPPLVDRKMAEALINNWRSGDRQN
ncbi:hypothetical protein [Pseudomonas sp. NPDC087029]|uniref:hypothetical protein n=1 Tax=Pseudomonas sp. NPDC087029 TaxID=3364433 RepID=UPI00382F3BBD